MVLLDQIIEVFNWSKLAPFGQLALSLELIHGLGISWVLVYVDYPRNGSMAGIKRPSQELFGSLGISMLPEQELQSITCRVHRSVQVQPLPFDFDVGLIYSPGIIGLF
jgi:hypothetical protein